MEAGGSGHRAFCGRSNKSPASPTPEQAVPDFLQRLLTSSSKQPVEVPRGRPASSLLTDSASTS